MKPHPLNLLQPREPLTFSDGRGESLTLQQWRCRSCGTVCNSNECLTHVWLFRGENGSEWQLCERKILEFFVSRGDAVEIKPEDPK